MAVQPSGGAVYSRGGKGFSAQSIRVKVERRRLMAQEGSKTKNNLQEAFAGESQANRRYLAFAKKAEQEGYKQVAKLFKAVAETDTAYATGHLCALGGIKSTK